jgi:hypothetical protein
MKTRNFIVISLLISLLVRCNSKPKNDTEKIIVENGRFEEVEDEVEPPPPQLISKFGTVKDWLVNICESDQPRKPISIYQVGLFESENDFTLFLVGINKYNEGQNRSVTHIEFQPINMYFKLPQQYFKNLDRKEVIKQLTEQLKEFTNTAKFKTSFLAQANKIVFTTNGEVIWVKNKH